MEKVASMKELPEEDPDETDLMNAEATAGERGGPCAKASVHFRGAAGFARGAAARKRGRSENNVFRLRVLDFMRR